MPPDPLPLNSPTIAASADPVTAGRTMALYPDLWATPLPNTSAHFDMAAVLARSQAGGRTAVGADESIPHLTGQIDTGVAHAVQVPPGTLLAFSGAHAHAGVRERAALKRRCAGVNCGVKGALPLIGGGGFQ